MSSGTGLVKSPLGLLSVPMRNGARGGLLFRTTEGPLQEDLPLLVMGLMQVEEATLRPATGTFLLKITVEEEGEEQAIMEVEEVVEVDVMGTTLTPTLKTQIILHDGEHLKNGSSIAS